MTKKEWFNDFKNHLDSLSNKDCQEAINYYEELYQDKLDQGFDPKTIIDDFPNPADAAKKILDDIPGEVIDLNESSAKKKNRKEKSEKRKAKSFRYPLWLTILFSILSVPLFIVFFALIIAFIAVFFSAFIVVLAGIVTIIFAVLEQFQNIGELIMSIGISFLSIAIGLLLIALFGNLLRLLIKVPGRLLHR